MLVFGDRERRCDPRAALEELARALGELAAGAPGAGELGPGERGPGGLARHGALGLAPAEARRLLELAGAEGTIASCSRSCIRRTWRSSSAGTRSQST